MSKWRRVDDMGIFSRRKNRPPEQVLSPPVAPAATTPPVSVEPSPAPPQSATHRQVHNVVHARRAGFPSVDVVGESFNIKSIAKAVQGQPGEHWMRATLVREPNNKYDTNAVRVDVGGRPGGHISREDATAFHTLLAAADRAGCTVEVDCRVWFDTGYGEQRASIRLDMVDPAFAWPVNPMAASEQVGIWPEGRRLKISPSSENLDGVQQMLAAAYEPGACSAYVQLSIPDEGSKLTALFNGAVLGHLSPAASKQMRPVVEAAGQNGRRVFAIVEAKGNSLAVDIKLLVAPAEDLTEPEIRALTG